MRKKFASSLDVNGSAIIKNDVTLTDLYGTSLEPRSIGVDSDGKVVLMDSTWYYLMPEADQPNPRYPGKPLRYGESEVIPIYKYNGIELNPGSYKISVTLIATANHWVSGDIFHITDTKQLEFSMYIDNGGNDKVSELKVIHHAGNWVHPKYDEGLLTEEDVKVELEIVSDTSDYVVIRITNNVLLRGGEIEPYIYVKYKIESNHFRTEETQP